MKTAPPKIDSPRSSGGRIVAIDVLRGGVILLLIPNVYGGFSFYEMAKREPDSQFWAALGAQMTHVTWGGGSLWDMIMPVFVFLVGVSMALSVERRRAAGDTTARLLAGAALRSLSLIVLGMSLLFQPTVGVFDALMPYLVLATGLPWSRWFDRSVLTRRRLLTLALDLFIPAFVVTAVGVWIVLHIDRLGDYDLNEILVQLGLAYLPAFLLAGRSLGAPARSAALILAAWGAAFLLYSPPPGMVPVGEVYDGLMGHWNNGTNVAAAFDRWFLNLLPRAVPYVGNAHGYHTLQFVPLIAQMLAGVVVGRMIWREPHQRSVVPRIAIAGVIGLALSAVLCGTLFPLVKSLWTPSWAVFSTSLCMLALAALMLVLQPPRYARFGLFVAMLGSNAVLLYVITFRDRWRLVQFWDRLLGVALSSSRLRPVLESMLVLCSLWALAWLLERSKVHLRI